MCGVVGTINRESVFSRKHYDMLFTAAEKRGQDGFGLVVIQSNGKVDAKVKRSVQAYSEVREEMLDWLGEKVDLGSIVFGICRAQPSTEVASTVKNMQPLVFGDKGVAIVHNGCVADFIVSRHRGEEPMVIDSEAIVREYVAQKRDMKKTMENLVGGFSFILFDSMQRRLYIVCDYKPMSIGYVRGVGFIAHSSEGAIREVVLDITGANRCGMNIWEDFYFHQQEGYVIRSIDVDSGMEREEKFMPRFVTPFIDTKDTGSGKKVLVLASGGIDSGLTAFVLHKLGYDTELLHFDYGHRGQEAEKLAVQKLQDRFKCCTRNIDFTGLYKYSKSSLLESGSELLTATEDYMKTTTAWVENRNQLFLSYATTVAEQEIFAKGLEEVYIVGGYANLEEEGIYPDNSERFVHSFFENVKYSSIVGHRIKFVNVMQDIMKYEEWALGGALGFPFEVTCSCDHPRVVDGQIELCRQCGSTLMSMWAAEQAGVEDPRKFYDRKVDFEVRKKRVSGKTRNISVCDIIDRLRLPSGVDKQILKRLAGRVG